MDSNKRQKLIQVGFSKIGILTAIDGQSLSLPKLKFL